MCPDISHSSVKCISFKLSRIRYATSRDQHYQHQMVVTGSWMEELNRLCLWHYGCGGLIDSGHVKPTSEQEDDVCPGVLGDSADDPRLISSLVHHGWVQDLCVHTPTHSVYTISSLGSMQAFRTDADAMQLSRLTSAWTPFGNIETSPHITIALSSLALSTDGQCVYVADDLGRIGSVTMDRLPMYADSQSIDKASALHRSALLQHGSDVACINALERVDTSTLASVNQLGQLKVWDLRAGLDRPQQRLVRPSGMQPLQCLASHPGQSHLLAVGGVEGSGAAAYIWDLRADQYPLTELACQGESVVEARFHPCQPRHLYLATETAGLLRISCRSETGSWTGFRGSDRKLVISNGLAGNTVVKSISSFDISNTHLVCAHSDAFIQTIPCDMM